VADGAKAAASNQPISLLDSAKAVALN